MDPYEVLGIGPGWDGDLRARRNALVKRHFESGEAPDEERMKAINRAYEELRGRSSTPRVVVFRGRVGESFMLDGRRFTVRPARDPAAVAVPLLAFGLLAFAFGWVGAAIGLVALLYGAWRRR